MIYDHYMNLMQKEIELVYYTGGGFNYTDIETMYVNELDYYIYNFKNLKEQEEKSKQDFRKAIFEYANKAIETLFKLLSRKQ